MLRTEDLKIGGMKLIQDDAFLKIGVDSILLAAFARPKKGERALELGCGSGVVELLLAARKSNILLDAIEIDEGAYKLARKNLELNSLGPNIRVFHRDLRKLEDFDTNYSLVISNPPYRKMGSGKLPENPSLLRALFEADCTVDDLCLAASRRLKNGGRFCVVYKPERLCALFCAMRENSLEPKRMVFVRHTADHSPALVLIGAIKGASAGLRLEETLTLKNRKGEETKRYQAIYKGGSL